MAADTYDILWKALLLKCPIAGFANAQQWIIWSFRQVIERRRWSWLLKRSQFILNNQYTTGTVAVTFNNNIVTGTGTAWTGALVNQQFRIGLLFPIYTITAVNSATQLTLEMPWGGSTLTAQGYQIYNAYVTPPNDFHDFVSVYDPALAWQLWTNVNQEDLNAWDSQRAAAGTGYAVAHQTYDTSISPPVPRYEIWPHQFVQKTYPFLYISRPPDLSDVGATIPRFVPGNILLDGALEQCCLWPGSDREHPNPMFSISLAQAYRTKFDKQLAELEVNDDEVQERDVTYRKMTGMPWAPFPYGPFGDAAFLQAHAL